MVVVVVVVVASELFKFMFKDLTITIVVHLEVVIACSNHRSYRTYLLFSDYGHPVQQMRTLYFCPVVSSVFFFFLA